MAMRLLPSLHYFRRKTSKDVHLLRGLGADHVFNGRKRTEVLLKQVMFSAAKQIGIGVGCLNGDCCLTLGYQLDKCFRETQRGANGVSSDQHP